MPHAQLQGDRPAAPNIEERLAELILLSPRACDAELVALGYRGQARARRAASVMAYRHIRRLRRIFVDKQPASELGPRENYLFVGPTGSGKTYLVETLFKNVLKVPTAVVDITQYSETGYIGEDVTAILSRLYEAAGGDLAWAACGIVCLDEFDKLASSRSNARFAGEGTTKDVSGFGVQRGLLTLLSGHDASFPAESGLAGMGSKLSMPLFGVSFVACGAFSGLRTTADFMAGGERIGFGRSAKARPAAEAIAVHYDDRMLEQTSAFAAYGFLPELIGRFSRLVAFDPLDDEVLRAILEDNLLVHYRREFAAEGLELAIDAEVIELIVARAKNREVGARGLRASLVPFLEEAAYGEFGGQRQGATVRLTLRGEDIVVSIA